MDQLVNVAVRVLISCFVVYVRLVLFVLLTKFCVCRRLLHAMHQAKVEEAVQQAKALRKAMETGKLAQTVSASSYITLNQFRVSALSSLKS